MSHFSKATNRDYTVPANGGSGVISVDCTGYVVEVNDPNGPGTLLAEYGLNASAAVEAAVTGRDVLDQFRHFSLDDPACKGCPVAGNAAECFDRAECMAGPCQKHDRAEPSLDWMDDPNAPAPGTYAFTARLMASCGPDDGFDWDAWKDEMKERDC
jgi:hypothetical protein